MARVREGNYTLSGLTGFEMRGKTVAVIGTGAIGYYAVLILQVCLDVLGVDAVAHTVQLIQCTLPIHTHYLCTGFWLQYCGIRSLPQPQGAGVGHPLCVAG